MTKQKFLTITEAAQRAGVTRQAIHLALQTGEFPGAFQVTAQPNAPYLIPLDELDDWIKKRGQVKKT